MHNFYKNRRFRYGIIILIISIIGYISVVSSIKDAERHFSEVAGDPRFEKEYWDNADKEERVRLADMKMAATIQLAQYKYGKPIFAIGIFLGLLLTGLSFIAIKSKVDKLIDQMEKNEH